MGGPRPSIGGRPPPLGGGPPPLFVMGGMVGGYGARLSSY